MTKAVPPFDYCCLFLLIVSTEVFWGVSSPQNFVPGGAREGSEG